MKFLRSLFICERVQIPNYVFETLVENVRVDLGRGNICMTEQCLHDAQIGTIVEEMAGESMAQHVWAHSACPQA